LAKEYGLGGFMYYHYWFSGTRILERPVQEILSSGEPDFPFCLCWANESWSRRWDGRENELLIRQEYSEEDIRNHCAWLADAFKDRRYIKVGTRPVFVIYRYHHIPQELDLLGRMRESLARLNCTDPYFVASNAHAPWHDFREAGFDNVLDFQPSFGRLRGVDDPRRRTVGRLLRNVRLGELNAKLRLYDYELACLAMEPPGLPFETIPCVAVGWDNSPRRQARAAVFVNHTPAAFGSMLERRLELWSAVEAVDRPLLRQRLERMGRRQLPGARRRVRSRLPGGARARRRKVSRRIDPTGGTDDSALSPMFLGR
jgi:hypothetical protein